MLVVCNCESSKSTRILIVDRNEKDFVLGICDGEWDLLWGVSASGGYWGCEEVMGWVLSTVDVVEEVISFENLGGLGVCGLLSLGMDVALRGQQVKDYCIQDCGSASAPRFAPCYAPHI